MFERFRRERDSGGVATLERPPRSTHSIPTTASGVAILDAPPNLTIGVQTTTPEPTTIRRNRPTIDQMRAPDDPAWWSHVLDHCHWAAPNSLERIELLEQQLAELEGQRRPDPKAIKAKRQELLKARMSYLYPQADLRAILSRTAAVPNTGELPIVALFPLGNPGDVERQCTISTQAWYRRDGEPAQFTSNVPLMAKLADLTRAISGNEAGTGFRLNWAAGLRGPFPPEAINEARRHGLFASAGGTATVPGGTRRGTAIGDGGAVELPEGTTVTALAPASWTEWDDDPIFVASLEENGQETSWIIAGDLALGRFILGGVGLRRFVGLGKTNA